MGPETVEMEPDPAAAGAVGLDAAGPGDASGSSDTPDAASDLTRLRRSRWLLLAGVPGGLLLGATTVADRASTRLWGDEVESDWIGVTVFVLGVVSWIGVWSVGAIVRRRVRPTGSGTAWAVGSLMLLYGLPYMWLIGEDAWGRRSRPQLVLCACCLGTLVLGAIGPLRVGVRGAVPALGYVGGVCFAAMCAMAFAGATRIARR